MNHKKGMTWVLVLGVLLLVGVTALYVLWPQIQPHATIRLGDGVFATRIAKTPEERGAGLSGTQSLREDQALLLAYDHDSKWLISMKDTHYPIDIIWLDSNKKVVYVVKNASPSENYPYEQFTPKTNARYVLEVSAGIVSQKSISIGSEASFDDNSLGEVK